jgi:MFS family permease
VIGIVAEVPSGALADRIGRRTALVGGALLAALGFAAWTAAPGLTGFAAGFVLWGLGGALASGAQEALLHDGLSAVGAADRYAQVQGWVGAAGLTAQVPAAGAATVLYVVGGYPLVGWASVGSCLATAVLAARLPEPVRGKAADGPASDGTAQDGSDADEPGYLATLRIGLVEAVALPAVRRAALAFALLFGLDAFEEYFALIARDLGTSTTWGPTALLAIPVVGALGAAAGGRAERLAGGALAAVLAVAAGVLALATAGSGPAGLLGLALFYGLYRAVLVVADARLQARIVGSARATVTSVANVVAELAAFAVYGAWVVGGATAVAVLVAAVALTLPVLLRRGG